MLLRSRQALTFTLGTPVGFLLPFFAIFGHDRFHLDGLVVSGPRYYAANLTTFAIVDAAFVKLTVLRVESREAGSLRRRQATPQGAVPKIVGRPAIAVVTTLCTSELLAVIGRLGYGVGRRGPSSPCGPSRGRRVTSDGRAHPVASAPGGDDAVAAPRPGPLGGRTRPHRLGPTPPAYSMACSHRRTSSSRPRTSTGLGQCASNACGVTAPRTSSTAVPARRS